MKTLLKRLSFPLKAGADRLKSLYSPLAKQLQFSLVHCFRQNLGQKSSWAPLASFLGFRQNLGQ